MRLRQPKLPKLLAAALFLAAFLAVPLAAAAFQITEESTHTFALSADGRLSLENVNGDVTITGWDRDEISIEAVKKGRSQEALDATEIEIDADADRIHVKTRYGDSDREWGRGRDAASVDYTIRLPRGAALDEIELVNGSLAIEDLAGEVVASLVNGRVRATGLTGEAEISTVNGELEVALSAIDADRSIELSSVNGSVELSLPAGADADVDASTVHGSIRNDFGLEVERASFVGRKLSGILGRGGARIELSNVNGSIDIRQRN